MTTAHDIAREIRQRFRTRMDGVVAETMRHSGSDYRVNWGVSLLHLRELASDYEPDIHVALELWGDNVRESKIMALMLMPPGEFTPDIAELWASTLQTQEIAEMAAKLLFARVSYAPRLAFALLSSADALRQVLGFGILSTIISGGQVPDERGLAELADQIATSLRNPSLAVRHAAYNCFVKLDTSDKLADSPCWHALCQTMAVDDGA